MRVEPPIMRVEPPPDYDAIEREAWQKNARNVPLRLSEDDPYILRRIQTYCGRSGYSRKEVHEKIKNDPMFAVHFAVEPRRQGLHEQAAAAWLKKIPGIAHFRTLPKSGKNDLRLNSDGEIQQGGTSKESKSLDFAWKTGTMVFYAMHKYTKEGGGNQDSQHKEMIELLRKFMRCEDKKCALIVIVDGPYYTKKKMEKLTHHTREKDPKSYACSIEHVPMIIQNYIQKLTTE